MSGDFEGKGGVIVTTAFSRIQFLGSFAVLAWLARMWTLAIKCVSDAIFIY
jgi:hypothetical protein